MCVLLSSGETRNYINIRKERSRLWDHSNMPDTAYVSIFRDNDLTHIMEDHFEIKLIARLLDQMYVVQAPVFPLRYDDAPPSAPQFPEHLHSLLTCS